MLPMGAEKGGVSGVRKNILLWLLAAVLLSICTVPFGYILIRAFFDDDGAFTALNYYQVFLASPQYLVRFFRSLALAVCIALGQVIFSVLAGFGFAKYRFPGKNIMFFLLMALMIMPLQVTLVPNYIVLDAIGLRNTYSALALPAIFVPLGTFLMTQTFRAIPQEVLYASKLDGCNDVMTLLKITVPIGKGGIACTLLLSFLDGWNMVEQPMVFLDHFDSYPISVALASVQAGKLGVQLACCVLVMIPPLLLFALFHQELVEGITLGQGK